MVDYNFDPLLKITNSTELKKFLHECIDDLIEKRKINFDNYNSGPIEWTKGDFETAKKNVQLFFKNSTIENNFDVRLEYLEEHIQEIIKCCLEIRKNDVFQYLARTYVLKNGNNLVENIDWRLKWVLGSSDLAILKEAYLQIDLNGVQNKDEKIQKTSISFEANLEQVDQIIKELKAVKKELSNK
ncbi:unnamed protein product [Psylliodes chrysocephalus]|uniref:COMM domain-containing protein n=1 Tax=Psylliodes chrysocephalus TaxID=3402493 RepID=A0A9P0CU12_9CUCU|nr:unnamed protein product [Psylliodes chrysocephala]